jgi:hypothetical protein
MTILDYSTVIPLYSVFFSGTTGIISRLLESELECVAPGEEICATTSTTTTSSSLPLPPPILHTKQRNINVQFLVINHPG